MSNRYLGHRGLGLLEILVASAILIVIALGLSSYLSGAFGTGSRLASKSTCQEVAAGVISQISSKENSLVVRNWLPRTHSTERRPGPLAGDPLCSRLDSTELCDRLDLFEGPGDFNASTVQYLSLNVRGAATWAQSLLFHPNYKGEICARGSAGNPDGKKFSPEQLSKLFFPAVDFTKMTWVKGGYLYIGEFQSGKEVACGSQVPAGLNDDIRFEVTLNLLYIDSATKQEASCSAKGAFTYANDRTPPSLQSVAAIGLSPLGCTCNRQWGFGDPQKLPQNSCEERLTAQIDMLGNEPGSLFVCEQSDPTVVAQSYCGLFGQMKQQDGLEFSLNRPSNARLAMGPLQDGTTYSLSIKAVDVAGQFSAPMGVSFKVQVGSGCANPATTCVGGGPAQDTCGNACPALTKTRSCPTACGNSACTNCDGCGGDCPATGSCGGGGGGGGGGCTPNCPASRCGKDDGCGDTCPPCGGGGGCTPDCPQSNCGQNDGCGGKCPDCPSSGCSKDTDCDSPSGVYGCVRIIGTALCCSLDSVKCENGVCKSCMRDYTCFLPGTAILTSDGGSKLIEDIEKGDRVLSGDVSRGEVRDREVVRLYRNWYEGDIIDVSFENGSRFTATENHGIWARRKDQNQFSWQSLSSLGVGSEVLYESDGELRPTFIRGFRIQFYAGPTYNFEASGLHNYFAEGILVHNASDCINSPPPECGGP